MKKIKIQYAIENNLSPKQEEILCKIQKATYENDRDFLANIPEEILKIAIFSQYCWDLDMCEDGKMQDKNLCLAIKKYWDDDGKVIKKF